MRAVEAVLFDYGQTLVTFEYPRAGLLEVLRNFRPTIEEAVGAPAPTAEAILEEVLMPLERHVRSSSEDEVDWLDEYRAAWTKAGLSLPDGLLYEILDAEQLCWDQIVEVDRDGLQTLSWLGSEGIKRGICSNAPFPPEMMRRQLATNGIGALVDAAVFSSDVGRRKPAPQMYRAALDAIGADAARTVFIGNSVREDYEGPVAQGMQAIIYTAHNGESPPAGVPTIARLTDLRSLL